VEIAKTDMTISMKTDKISFERKSLELKADRFFIQKYEVSNQEFCALYPKHCLDSTQMGEPVVNVSEIEAQSYCKKIGGSLPTEVEWIIASGVAQGKKNCYNNLQKTKYYEFATKTYPLHSQDRCVVEHLQRVDDESDSRFYYIDSYIVDVKDSFININNTYGMMGNVWEMTKTIYQKRDGYIIVKGGSYLQSEERLLLKNSFENAIPNNTNRYNHIGFRCVKR